MFRAPQKAIILDVLALDTPLSLGSTPGYKMSKNEIVVQLGRKSDGSTARRAPFVVIAENAERCGLCGNEPAVIAQLAPDEDRGWFEAMWDGEWKFGRRVGGVSAQGTKIGKPRRPSAAG